MDTRITTGAAVIGATGLTQPMQEAVGDLFLWLNLHGHPSAWALLILAVVGTVMHRQQKCQQKDQPNE